MANHKIRRRAMLGAALGLLASAAGSPAIANAAERDCSVSSGDIMACKHFYEVSVRNFASTNVTVDFVPGEGSRKAVHFEDHAGVAALPRTLTVPGGGERSPRFSMASEGAARPELGLGGMQILAFESALRVNAGRVNSDVSEVSATLVQEGNVWLFSPDTPPPPPFDVGRQENSGMVVTGVTTLPPSSDEFFAHYVIAIRDARGERPADTPLHDGERRATHALTGVNANFKLRGLEPNVDYKLTACAGEGWTESQLNGYQLTSDDFTNGLWATTNDWGELVFSGDSQTGLSCVLSAAELDARATRLTGDAVDAPVYRVDIPNTERRYPDGLPNEIAQPAYKVHGQDASGTWHSIGTVLPTGDPEVDRSDATVTAGAAAFYFENTEGFKRIRVAGGYGLSFLDLSDAPGPPTGLQAEVASVQVAPATGLPITANGLNQEPLKLQIRNSNFEVVNSDDHGALGDLYNYVYFRDANGKLITGMFERGGYLAISPVRSAYVNTAMMLQSANDRPNRVYLSATTPGVMTQVRAHLSIDTAQRSPLSTPGIATAAVAASAAAESARGTGVILIDGQGVRTAPVSPESGVLYYPRNGGEPRASVLTRYPARLASTVAPIDEKDYYGWYELENDGLSFNLGTRVDLNLSQPLESHFVTTAGTHVVASSIYPH